MVQAKSELFEQDLIDKAKLFKVLSHPARLFILQYLAESQTCITTDLSNELPLGRTTINQHLAELKDAGLIQGEISGVNRKYCLNPSNIKQLQVLLSEFMNYLNQQNIECK